MPLDVFQVESPEEKLPPKSQDPPPIHYLEFTSTGLAHVYTKISYNISLQKLQSHCGLQDYLQIQRLIISIPIGSARSFFISAAAHTLPRYANSFSSMIRP